MKKSNKVVDNATSENFGKQQILAGEALSDLLSYDIWREELLDLSLFYPIIVNLLTNTERIILEEKINGSSATQIAIDLGISKKTVWEATSRIKQKYKDRYYDKSRFGKLCSNLKQKTKCDKIKKEN